MILLAADPDIKPCGLDRIFVASHCDGSSYTVRVLNNCSGRVSCESSDDTRSIVAQARLNQLLMSRYEIAINS